MKAHDVVTQLIAELPLLTDEFTTSRSNLTGFVADIDGQCSFSIPADEDFGLEVGDWFVVSGCQTAIAVDIQRTGTVGVITTSTAHDRTLGRNDPTTVTIQGANENEFNGTFTISAVTNRYMIEIQMEDAGATSSTGQTIAIDIESAARQYNGLHVVSTVPEAFTIRSVGNAPTGDADHLVISIHTGWRIGAAASVERALEGYSEQSAGDDWLWVVLDDVEAIDARRINHISEDYRQPVMQGFTVYWFTPSVTSRHGYLARDRAEDLLPLLCQCLLGAKFDASLHEGAIFPVSFVSHGRVRYDEAGGAFYVHAFNFAARADIQWEDTVRGDVHVAFRDIDITLAPALGGTGTIVSAVDLDETPA